MATSTSPPPRFCLPEYTTQRLTPKLHTPPASPESGFTTPNRRLSRPEPLRILTSPSESLIRSRASTTGVDNLRMLHDSGAITPPPTPTNVFRSKKMSIDSAEAMSNRRRGDSVNSMTPTAQKHSKPPVEEREKPGSTRLKVFKHWMTDYQIKDKKKPLGSGLWSDVYFAIPTLPTSPSTSPPTSSSTLTSHPPSSLGAETTPPITPVTKRRTSSLSPPQAYAIKTPASRSAKQVLLQEAKILSYLSSFPSAEEYIVPFYGLDTRSDALVLKAMDTTLESWIRDSLNTLPEAERNQKLGDMFKEVALSLLDGLAWMQEKGVTHADIKPSNILLSRDEEKGGAWSVLYSDFSSATRAASSAAAEGGADTRANTDTKPAAPLGGGTWDFLDPTLLTKSTPPSTTSPSPSATTDFWSLGITLLYVVIGSSPFGCAGSNVFRRREIIKHGAPMVYVGYGDGGPRNMKRLEALSGVLDMDVGRWFGVALKKDGRERVGLEAWRLVLEGAGAGAGRRGGVKI